MRTTESSRGIRAFGVVVVSVAIVTPEISRGAAAQTRTECTAVERIASVTRSSKLLLSVASDGTKKYCHFFVSMPPPFSIRGSVDAWFREAARRDPKRLVEIVSDLAVAAIPDDDEQTVKEVKLRIENNSDLLWTCVSKLIDKSPFDGKGGGLSCIASPSVDEAVVTVSFGSFTSSVVLPRPA
jgi:hypothetical protein